jgi:hypothetical protein
MKKLTSFILAVMIISPSIILAQYSNTLRIKINGYGYSDETIIRFIDGATPNFDGNYDAWKLFSPNPMVPSIYSKTHCGDELSINSLPIYNRDTTIEIHTKVAYSGLYTVTIEEVYAFDDDFVLSITDIENAETYSFSGGTTTFTCVLQPNTTTATFNFNAAKTISTSIKNEINQDDFKVLTKSNGNFELLFDNNAVRNITIYDITGKTVLQEVVNNNSFYLNLENQNTGLYIVAINNGTETVTRKIFR